jgi:antitoxin (DNA-binding transcriptional repressor) of toxin-antitoxin stability system
MRTNYFDTLPVHPAPARLESFCSYLIRLAEANGVGATDKWLRLCFPTGQPRLTPHTGDFAPVSFGVLPEMALCSEEVLLKTTFYHLVKKFGRSTGPLPMSHFLSGSLAKQLRYCPVCLAERGYYLLTWRFLTLPGCPEHGCELRDRCDHCGQSIPLLPLSSLKMSLCPQCGRDLSLCHSPALDERTRQRAWARERDLVYLLTPQPYETLGEQLKKQIGDQLAYQRLSRQLKVIKIARELGQTAMALHVIEGRSTVPGGKFALYGQYADYLEIDFQTLFEAPPPAEETYEDILVNRVQQIINRLLQSGQWVTKNDLAQLVKLDPTAFERYPKLKALWSAFLAQRRQARYTGLVEQIRQTAAQLEKDGQPVSVSRISRRMGRHPSDMSQYPLTAAAMKQVAGQAVQARYEEQREEQLLQLVQEALVDLEVRGERISKGAICRRLGVCLETLTSRPRIRTFLTEQVTARTQEHLTRQRRQREAELLERVQQGVKTLQATGHRITVPAICQVISKSEHCLRSYPGVDTFLKQVVQEVLPQQRRQREAELLRRVQQGVEALQAAGRPVNIRAICQTINKSENGLRPYPSVASFFRQVVTSNRQAPAGG